MRRRKTAIFFLVLGFCLAILAGALNIGWIILNIREVVLLVLGIIFFALIITGLILNSIFLFREIKRNEQHDAFLNSVTHELKTPIASIKLYLETLQSRPVPDEKRQEFYDVMLADCDRLNATVEQVLLASRTRENKLEMNITDIDLGSLLDETAGIVETRYNLDDGSIRIAKPADPIRVAGDKKELQTAFTNILDNAVKYSNGDPKVSVRLTTTGGNNNAGVFIKDSGIGIPPRDLKRIFKRFYRVPNDATHAAKGTGLGLPIVKSILQRHGGTVTAQSNGEGKGSTFIIQLPRE